MPPLPVSSASLSVSTDAPADHESIPVLIQPWGAEVYPEEDPFEMMNRIGACYGKSRPRDDNAAVLVAEGDEDDNNNGVLDLCCESVLCC